MVRVKSQDALRSALKNNLTKMGFRCSYSGISLQIQDAMASNSSNQIRLSGTTWGELKETALRPNYMEKSPFVSAKSFNEVN